MRASLMTTITKLSSANQDPILLVEEPVDQSNHLLKGRAPLRAEFESNQARARSAKIEEA
jgi:hypothetical protein